MTKRALLLLIAIVGLGLLTEGLLRVFVGFPALYVPHPVIEYVNAPDQNSSYRGKRIQTNRFGMRSPEFEIAKPEDAFRVAILGDSIVNGHNFTDQADIATSLLGRYVTADGRRVEVLNISANSWGPGNLLAWIDENGLFNADAAVLVQNTDDRDDDRAFLELIPNSRPFRKPVSIIWDIFERKIAARIGLRTWPRTPYEPQAMPGDARASLPVLLDRLNALPEGVCLVVHENLSELEDGPAGDIVDQFAGVAADHDAPIILDRAYIEFPAGYVDNIHPSVLGQTQMLEAMLACPNLAGLRCTTGPNCAP